MDTKLLELLVCPVTKGPLDLRTARSRSCSSRSARLAYPVRDGIPVLLENEARTLSDEELERLRRGPRWSTASRSWFRRGLASTRLLEQAPGRYRGPADGGARGAARGAVRTQRAWSSRPIMRAHRRRLAACHGVEVILTREDHPQRQRPPGRGLRTAGPARATI